MTLLSRAPEPALSPEQFYAGLVERNAGFITAGSQDRLARATVLVAGCGSTGGAALEPLVRLGVQHLVLADIGRYELNNLNRQSAFLHELGRNKAELCAERAVLINPHATAVVHPEGITETNVGELVTAADVVLDGVDVTTKDGWWAKYLTHRAAAAAGVPVITGYDMAGCQYIRFYDYRRESEPFGGRLTEDRIERLSSLQLLRKVLPLRHVPLEMLQEARRGLHEPERSVPQLVYTSMLFGALASRMVIDVLDGRAIRRHTCVDVHAAVAPRHRGLAGAVRKPWTLIAGLRELRAVSSSGAGRAPSG